MSDAGRDILFWNALVSTEYVYGGKEFLVESATLQLSVMPQKMRARRFVKNGHKRKLQFRNI